MDQKTNSYGDRLLEFCQSVPLRICNGRKFGDVVGSFTCYRPNGQSVVDYCIVSLRFYPCVASFLVNELLPDLSDHCSCTVTIKTKFVFDDISSETYVFLSKPKKVPWNEEISDKFERNIQNELSKAFLAQFSTNNS